MLSRIRRFDFDTVDSTNLRLREILSQEKPESGKEGEGLLVVANYQTAGRGRLTGRSWVSPPGKGLTFSMTVSLQQKFWEGRVTRLPLLVGVALLEALDQVAGSGLGGRFAERLLLKWPNDVYLDGKKLSGVLIENVGEVAIVGIGVNLNSDPSDFPHEVMEKATSLKMATGREWDREMVLQAFLLKMQNHLERWQADGEREWQEVLRFYRNRFYLKGREAEYTLTGETPVKVQVIDVTEEGTLRVRYPDGHEEALQAGDVNPLI